jgi:tetratricopeptide (TPR) repeat protein
LDFICSIEASNSDYYLSRGNAKAGNGDLEGANADYSESIRLNPTNGSALFNHAAILEKKGEWNLALNAYKKAVQIKPDMAEAHNAMSWIYATCQDGTVRNGSLAVDEARTACDMVGWKDWNYIDTLAAAYAENGNYEEAVKWEKASIASGMPATALHEAEARLVLFQQGKAYHITGP